MRKKWGMMLVENWEYKNKERHKKHPLTKKQVDSFLNSGVNIAISHQRFSGNVPHHFLLIVKDKEGIWRNMDHTDSSSEHRGGETDFDKVYALAYDTPAQRRARELMSNIEKKNKKGTVKK